MRKDDSRQRPQLALVSKMTDSNNDDSVFSTDDRGQLITTEHLDNNDDNSTKNGLGWFNGVFAPVTLSMFSSLLFLRIGYIVGNAGILESFLQIMIAYVILVFTVLSICAIATNGAIKGGGVYFMISRTLGPEFGGSIGILFYFANVAGSALYAVACSESLINSFGENGLIANFLPSTKWFQIFYSMIINVLNLIICIVGPKLFGKTTTFVLLAILTCTLSVFASFFSDETISVTFNETLWNCTDPNCTHYIYEGHFAGLSNSRWNWSVFDTHIFSSYSQDCDDPSKPIDFSTVFGVLFSGVTGIMAGANLSGDLTSPSKSIPKGTLSACLFTFSTYILLFLLTAMTCDQVLLLHDCMYMTTFNFWNPFVTIGTVLATFCASASNMIGASRVLEAVSKDTMFGIILEWITYGTYKNNPILAVVVTWFLINFAFFVGGLNTIAQFVSVLFLLSYASVNLSCLGLDLASAPNFRPTFKYFSWQTCTVGLAGTVVMMFVINPLVSALSILLCIILLLCLNFLSPSKHQDWGSISQALLFHQVRKYLLLLDPRKDHVKFWRPQVLLLVSNPRTHCSLIDFGNALKKGGLYVLGHVQTGNFEEMEEDSCSSQTPNWLKLIDHLRIKAFVELTVAPTVRAGVQQLIRISGIGAMKPNTIIMGFQFGGNKTDYFGTIDSEFYSEDLDEVFPAITSSSETQVDYVGILNDIVKLKKNLCICRNFEKLDREAVSLRTGRRFFGNRNGGDKLYLDIWINDFISNSSAVTTTAGALSRDILCSDSTSVFLLQLACIVNMVPRWKVLKLRVYMCVKGSDSNIGLKEERINRELLMLRINAQVNILALDTVEPIESTNDIYLRKANELILSHSTQTAVEFLYLPKPPKDKNLHDNFIKSIKLLTDNLPPTVLVHGISPVISTTL